MSTNNPLVVPTTESIAFEDMFNTSLDVNNVGAEQRYNERAAHEQHERNRPVQWQRISKREAQRLFALGDTAIFLCPCKLRPGFPWNVAAHVFGREYLEDAKRYLPRENSGTINGEICWQAAQAGILKMDINKIAWDLMYNSFAYYNLTSETGRYAHYYIER